MTETKFNKCDRKNKYGREIHLKKWMKTTVLIFINSNWFGFMPMAKVNQS